MHTICAPCIHAIFPFLQKSIHNNKQLIKAKENIILYCNIKDTSHLKFIKDNLTLNSSLRLWLKKIYVHLNLFLNSHLSILI